MKKTIFNSKGIAFILFLLVLSNAFAQSKPLQDSSRQTTKTNQAVNAQKIDPSKYRISTSRSNEIMDIVILQTKQTGLDSADAVDTIMSNVRKKMSLVPSKQIQKTDSKTISEKAREIVRQKTVSSDIVKIENEAKEKYPLYKVGDRVSFNYFMGGRAYSVKGKLIRITKKSITVDDKMINLIDLDPKETSKFDSVVNQKLRSDYIRTRTLSENKVNATEVQNESNKLITQLFKINEDNGYIYNPDNGKWETPKEVANNHINRVKRLLQNGYEEGMTAYDKKDYKTAVNIFIILAKLEKANSQYMVGKCYLEGTGLKQDYKEALKWLRQAAEQEVAAAQYEVGHCYEMEFGVRRNLKEAFQWYLKAAEQGYALAQNVVGAWYLIGRGVEENEEEANRWFNKAVETWTEEAEAGNAEAQLQLYYCYIRGRGDYDRDLVKATKWLTLSAENGNVRAQFTLAQCYSVGLDISKNEKEAFKWYRKAAEQGHADAQYYLALCYYNGEGVEKNQQEAVKWYRKAAEQKDGMGDMAQFCLGMCYEFGNGVKQDFAEAAKWYQKSAEQGNCHGQLALGYLYGSGRGVKQDFVEAEKWLRKSAEQGVPEAQLELWKYYYSGRNGVKKDYQEAKKWIRKAAEQDYGEAQYILGSMYLQERNETEALTWIMKAADNGNTSAIRFLNSL